MAKITLSNVIIGPNEDGIDALLDIPHLEITDGDKIGVVGTNGAGKTTLLKLLSGAIQPNFGTIQIDGLVQPIINISSGIDDSLNALDNIKLLMALRNIRDIDAHELTEQVLALCKIDTSFKYKKLKYFSSGMKTNFALALSTHYESDILILDEFVSTRDARFNTKRSKLSLQSVIEKSKITVLCSHSMRRIKENCKHTIFLHQGKIRAFGPTKNIIKRYEKFIEKKALPKRKRQ